MKSEVQKLGGAAASLDPRDTARTRAHLIGQGAHTTLQAEEVVNAIQQVDLKAFPEKWSPWRAGMAAGAVSEQLLSQPWALQQCEGHQTAAAQRMPRCAPFLCAGLIQCPVVPIWGVAILQTGQRQKATAVVHTRRRSPAQRRRAWSAECSGRGPSTAPSK